MKRFSNALFNISLTAGLVACASVVQGATVKGVKAGAAANRAAATKSSPKATARLESRSGSTVTGTAEFKESGGGGVKITVKINGATPGTHGLHLHENGDCSAPDASSAGGHFNPTQSEHGAPMSTPHHAGDLGNISIGKNGKGKLTLTMPGLTVAPGANSVVGRSIVFHAATDDLKSQPAGNSGARQACGVINAAGH